MVTAVGELPLPVLVHLVSRVLVLCAWVLDVQVACHGAQVCFSSLLLALSGTFLSLSVSVKVRNSKALWLRGSSSLLSDYSESRHFSPGVLSIKSLWQQHRCFFFPACHLDPYVLAFVFRSARVGKARRAERLFEELGTWEESVADSPLHVAVSVLHGAARARTGDNSDQLNS